MGMYGQPDDIMKLLSPMWNDKPFVVYDVEEGWGVAKGPQPANGITGCTIIRACVENSGGSETNLAAILIAPDGLYYNLIAYCDYTGWDCQAGGVREVWTTFEEAYNAIDDGFRSHLHVLHIIL